MLISHKYKFIYIKNVKVGGTSTEVELSKIMGETDVITPYITRVDDYIIPRNYKINDEIVFEKEHMDARVVRNLIGPEIFNSYYKFCVEREPVDKCISHFSMFKNCTFFHTLYPDLTWKKYIENKRFPIDYDRYTDEDGNLIVDKIIKYEQLTDDLIEISKLLGFPFTKLTIRAKSEWREYINPTYIDRKIIYEAFEPTLKFTGYTL